MPRFSVILPTRGRPDWLPEAVDSVLAQTFADWELVILDNSDSPYYTISPWDDPRVRYLWEPCTGIADASTRAIGYSTGDILVPLGDDDLLPEDALEHSDRTIGGHMWLNGRTLIRNQDGVVVAERGGTLEAVATTRAGTFWLGGAVHWKRELTDRLPAYRQQFDGAADYDLYLRFLNDSDPVVTDHVMYLYTDWPGTDSRVRAANQAEATARIRGG